MWLTFFLKWFPIALILMSITPTTNAQAPTRMLPLDVIFMSRENLSSASDAMGEFRTSLVWLNAETLDTETFFVDETAYLLPLEWSPNSELFAVLRFDQSSFFDIPPQLCLLTRNGELYSCMDDSPPRSPGVASDGLYRITWSANGQQIYFLSDEFSSTTQGTRRIIEANVATGETQQIIFEVPFEHDAPVISWTSDLSTAVIGVGNYQQYQGPKKIVNLRTREEVDPSTLIPDSMRLHQICPEFSPFDTYMAFLAVTDVDSLTEPYNFTLYVLDADWVSVFVMNEDSGYGQIEWGNCPIWQSNEESIVFAASTEYAKRLPVGSALSRIFKYDFETEELEIYFENDLLASGFGSLSLATDGNHLVFSTQYYTTEGTQIHRTWQLVVAFPDGDFIEIQSPQGIGVDWWYPIWVPSLSDE